jgi:hypothetical protein
MGLHATSLERTIAGAVPKLHLEPVIAPCRGDNTKHGVESGQQTWAASNGGDEEAV